MTSLLTAWFTGVLCCALFVLIASWWMEAGKGGRSLTAFLYFPGDWMGTKFTARQRRAIAAWLFIGSLIAIPTSYPFRSYISVVWLVSMIALTLACGSWASAETPVEEEDE